MLYEVITDRKVAEQQQEMYLMQKASEEKRQDFVKAQTAATKEEELTAARYNKEIATQVADAKVETAKGERESAKITADGEAYVLTTVGAAKADNIDKVGTAEAGVIHVITSYSIHYTKLYDVEKDCSFPSLHLLQSPRQHRESREIRLIEMPCV